MKKIILFIITLFIFTGIAKAQVCTYDKGTGEDIGDEVTCGTETFYIVNHNDETTTLLAKYNLYVGDIIDFLPIEEELDYIEANYDSEEAYCLVLAARHNYNPYYVLATQDMNGNPGCRVYEKIEYEHVVQNKKAEGTKLVNGKSQLPLYGITYMVPTWGYEAIHDGIVKENVYDSNGNLILAGSSFEKYINGYKDELIRQGINVDRVDFFTLNDILDLAERISGHEIEVTLEYINGHDPNDPESYIGKMNIKDYIPAKYGWVYDRTYWNGSGFKYEDQDPNHLISPSEFNDYYISNEGFLCALGRGQCGYLAYPIGNGVRPIVVVKNEYVKSVSEISMDEDKENPDTGTFISYLVIVIGGISSISLYLVTQRRKLINKVG